MLLVFAGVLVAFGAGVELSERPGIPEASLLVRVYSAIGLFVLGGLDLGTPIGGPAWARAVLWVCFFAAPAITTTAVAEGILRATRPAWLAFFLEKQHVVVFGDTPIARRYAEAVALAEPGRHVRTLACLDASEAGLQRASAVVIASNDDLQNLGFAWNLRERWPDLRITAHTGEIGLRRSSAHLADLAGVRLFNAFEIAADATFVEVLAPHLEATAGRDVVCVLGFGRFGQTVLEHLFQRARGEVERVVVVDRRAQMGLRRFDEHVNRDPAVVLEPLDADLLDPATWDRLMDALASAPEPPMIVVTTDDDATNLQAAIGLRERLPHARIFARFGYGSAFLEQLRVRSGVDAIPVDRLLREALEQHHLAP